MRYKGTSQLYRFQQVIATLSPLYTMGSLRTFSVIYAAITLANIAAASPTPTLDTRQLPIGCPVGATLQCCSAVTPV